MAKETENNKVSSAKYAVNYGHDVITLPAAVLDVFHSAKKSDVYVLLAFLSDRDAEISLIAKKCDMDAQAVERSLSFWRGTGIISYVETEQTVAAPEQKTEEKPDQKIKKASSKRGELGSLPSYSSGEIAQIVEGDRSLALMIDECERALGKIFRTGETAKILALREYLGFSPEYIVTLCAYCAKLGKTSVRYLETTAIALYDDGITDKESLEEHLKLAEEKHALETKIRALFGINMSRELTTKEKRLVDSWIVNFGYGIEVIKLAYEITVDRINEPSLNYANAILESWHSKELSTEEEIRALLEAEAGEKQTPAGKSFDSTDFFEAALRRSYSGSGTAPEIPKENKSKKKKQ